MQKGILHVKNQDLRRTVAAKCAKEQYLEAEFAVKGIRLFPTEFVGIREQYREECVIEFIHFDLPPSAP